MGEMASSNFSNTSNKYVLSKNFIEVGTVLAYSVYYSHFLCKPNEVLNYKVESK